MTHPSRYYADDKDVFDVLMSNPRKLNDDVLRRFLRRRGFIVAGGMERTMLAAYVSRLPLGWRDVQSLMDLLGQPKARAPRVTSERVAVELEAIREAANKVRDLRSERRGERFRVLAREDGSGIDVHVDYSVLDTTKNRLRQRSEEHLKIAVEPSGNGAVRLRFPEEPRAREITDAIILGALGDPKNVVRDTVDLSGCSAVQRTRFFELLMNNTAGFSLRNVSRAGFRRHGSEAVDDDGDTEDSALPGEEDEDSGARILRVQLDGAGVFQSEEFQELKSRGFYVSGAVWRARQDGGEGVDAEFDANFVRTELGEAFSYKLRGVFRRDEAGEQSRTRAMPSEHERTTFLRHLEESAALAQKEVCVSAQEPDALGEPADEEPDPSRGGGDS